MASAEPTLAELEAELARREQAEAKPKGPTLAELEAELTRREYGTPGQAALRGALEGGTYNWSAELTAAFGAGMYGAAKGVRALGELVGQGGVPEGAPAVMDVYRAIRDSEEARTAAARSEQPGVFFGSSIAAGLATPNPLGKLRAGGAAASAALQGGVAGALGALGGSDADLTQGELGEAAGDTALGAGLGAAFGLGAGALAERAGKRAASAAQRAADAKEATRIEAELADQPLRAAARREQIRLQKEAFAQAKTARSAAQSALDAAADADRAVRQEMVDRAASAPTKDKALLLLGLEGRQKMLGGEERARRLAQELFHEPLDRAPLPQSPLSGISTQDAQAIYRYTGAKTAGLVSSAQAAPEDLAVIARLARHPIDPQKVAGSLKRGIALSAEDATELLTNGTGRILQTRGTSSFSNDYGIALDLATANAKATGKVPVIIRLTNPKEIRGLAVPAQLSQHPDDAEIVLSELNKLQILGIKGNVKSPLGLEIAVKALPPEAPAGRTVLGAYLDLPAEQGLAFARGLREGVGETLGEFRDALAQSPEVSLARGAVEQALETAVARHGALTPSQERTREALFRSLEAVAGEADSVSPVALRQLIGEVTDSLYSSGGMKGGSSAWVLRQAERALTDMEKRLVAENLGPEQFEVYQDALRRYGLFSALEAGAKVQLGRVNALRPRVNLPRGPRVPEAPGTVLPPVPKPVPPPPVPPVAGADRLPELRKAFEPSLARRVLGRGLEGAGGAAGAVGGGLLFGGTGVPGLGYAGAAGGGAVGRKLVDQLLERTLYKTPTVQALEQRAQGLAQRATREGQVLRAFMRGRPTVPLTQRAEGNASPLANLLYEFQQARNQKKETP